MPATTNPAPAVETLTASVAEMGNGFPSAGDYVSDGEGTLYRVIKSGSRIETQQPGAPNICLGYVLEVADWNDAESDDDVHPSQAIVSE